MALAALVTLGLAAHSARAQTITLTPADSNVGAAGAPGGGTQYGTLNGDPLFYGNDGSDGYDAKNSNFLINGPTLTGGAGGEVTGTDAANDYLAGRGGDGLMMLNSSATINGGTFTGGIGGTANGTGKYLISGGGGNGLLVYSSTISISGGVFQGGNGGPEAMMGNGGGSGLYIDGGNTTANIYGGTFTSANGASSADFVNTGGNVNIYGGTFTGGANGFSGPLGVSTEAGTTTLYGSDFFVNGVATSSGSVTGFGTITGKLQDNVTTSTFTFLVGSGGTLNLNSAPAAVPEASTTISFGLLIALGLGGVMLARKKNAVA